MSGPTGRRTVKTDPLPDSLATVTSPPIMRASLRWQCQAPVPPKFCAIEGIGLAELLEQLCLLLRRHADAGVGDRKRDPFAAVLLSLTSGDGDGALFGELVGVAHEVQRCLPEPHLIGMHVRWS
jgi:hypothetical protein